MSEATAIAEPAAEVVSTPAPEVVSTPAPEVVTPTEERIVSTPSTEALPEATPVPTPQAEAPKPVETPRVRTLADIHDDVINDRNVKPSELQQYNRAVAEWEQGQQAQRAHQEQVEKLFPSAASEIVNAIASYTGLDPSDLGLQKIVEDRLLHGPNAASKLASEAILTPYFNQQGGQLYGYTNQTPETLQRLKSLKPDQVVPTAVSLGYAMAQRDLTSNGDYISKKEHEKAVADAARLALIEFETAHPERVSQIGNAASTGGAGFVEPKTLADAEQMVAGMHPSGQQMSTAQFRAWRARQRS